MGFLFGVSMWICFFVAVLIHLMVIRACYLLFRISKNRVSDDIWVEQRKGPFRTMVIIGSGGHTSEMLRLLRGLNNMYSPKEYILAATDKTSEVRVLTAEKAFKEKGIESKYSITKIPRSREVRQSYITSIATTLYASLYSFPIVFKSKPDVIICNGPGTCVPLCAAAFLSTIIAWKKVTVVYVESVCRVESLSLSGKILYHFVDQMLVQWPQLQKKYPKTRYIGRIV